VKYSYFRVQQELAKLILSALDSKPSIEEAADLDHHRLGLLMLNAESPSMEDLYAAGDRFRIWLADTDLRQKDSEYDKLLSDDIRAWAEANIFKPDSA
jgi:hypothetical protein